MKIGEYEYEVLEKARSITLTNYLENIKWFNAEEIDGYLDPAELFPLIEDLFCEINSLNEKIEDLENKEKQESEYDLYDLWIENKEGII